MDGLADTERHLSAFRDIIGSKYVLDEEDGTSPFLKDWTGDYPSTPLCVLQPASVGEVSRLLAYCGQNGLSVLPQGGNSGLVGGCFTTDASGAVLLNLGRMNAVRKLDAANYTVTVDAGCIVQQIQQAASDQNRLFPLSFGAQGSAQIGGAVSTNAGGLNVLRYGMTRDLVLGLEVVLPDGRVMDCLSSLRKDNRGLDLKQLFIGAEGTLGIVTGLTLKLFPKPTQSETAFLALPGNDEVVALYGLAREYCADLLTAFELIPRRCIDLALGHQGALRDPLEAPYQTYVLMRAAASGPVPLRDLVEGLLEQAMERGLVLDGALAESVAQANAMWAIREAMVEVQSTMGKHLRTDISVAVSETPAFIARAEAAVTARHPDWETLAYGHVGDGNIHFNAFPTGGQTPAQVNDQLPRIRDALYTVLDEFGGSISAEHGIGRSRIKEHYQRQDPAATWLSDAIKGLLDPNGTLNPGCLFEPAGRASNS